MKNYSFIPMLNLQLFAEGAGDGGTAEGQGVTGTAAGSQEGVISPVDGQTAAPEKAPAAEVQKETAAQPDLNAEFEKLIKGQYKEQFNAKMQDTVRKRLSETRETVDKYNALSPTLQMLAKKYGVDANDIKALNEAIENDDAYYEQEALERGLSVKQLKELRKVERENADLKRQMEAQQRQENARKQYTAWMKQADSAKQVYPSFDLRTELQNPQFRELISNNIDVKTAYEVIHRDEIIPAAMQFAAKTVESKIAKKIASGGSRPSENGMASQSAAVVKSDVSKLTNRDIDDIYRRVAGGEKVTFG